MKRRGSCLSLVTFCATTAVVLALALAILFASVTVAFALAHTVAPLFEQNTATTNNQAGIQPEAEEQPVAAMQESFAGLVTDDHCGARHDMGSDKSPAECANACVHNGAKYALVDGDKKYELEGDGAELSRASGRRVNLIGSLSGNTIQVISVDE